jgi:predicted GNAT superfamily acetyltransferase
MLPSRDTAALHRQAEDAATRAARLAGVRVADESAMGSLRQIAEMLVTVWGTSAQGAPIPADLLRSISHAGCNVSAAYTADNTLCGAAVAIAAPDEPVMYSLIAGVLPWVADRGVGFALKQHQRAWALARGLETMTWTFDPLVSRNARFNLTKLGAHAAEYERDFYGLMEDGINANDESDRLVAVWPLGSETTIACSTGEAVQPILPSFPARDVRVLGPDGEPAFVQATNGLWCRVPADIVALRGTDPAQAAAWRTLMREIFTGAFSAGYTARAVTRAGWYRLDTGDQA